ncbi:hypothetical protein [Nocardia transvalensis]|uniref:hypothetical protein n=1 Tax=Nocardia transvalensis TaxID=37333 RepID=UPI0018936448|nr:hypothetical protein [Nocardia transvalensis]MBF6334005.1 hypothetical protein [Nocardia transvalensis]
MSTHKNRARAVSTRLAHWNSPRILVAIVLGFSLLGPLLADLAIPDVAELHLHNPAWPPHAKFGLDAQLFIAVVMLVLLAAALLLEGRRERRH